MAFKFIVLFSILAAAANAGHLSGGYIHDDPYVSYAPAVHKTLHTAAYATPVAKTIEYAPVAKAVYEKPLYTAPIAKAVYEPEPIQYHNYHAAPVVAKSYGYEAPAYHHGETLSHYGKIVSSPHSYVKKYDTRIISDDHHYKTVAYPAVPTVYKTPVVPAVVKAPIYPTVVKTPVVPSFVKSYEPEYAHHSYAHAAPVVAAKVAYSPAAVVAHTSFESANAHYAW